ncbi:NAD-dependent epimerase/dehydratase family protein [Pseudoalteromonas luteoviolacea]|nr:NAD-dependent epimerase/dehydratase family protein [Pseudoalteromonas luteoviolacea]AOT06593.1 NADP-binding protein [Pseudoalteromonas luteoviolacea]AOT11510.1 NADP-binding protein [Pseudoalteromonas luteoviolacea]AOT16423.1 NADP-binding protein [Pseudoalteromonas luteoviolacea]
MMNNKLVVLGAGWLGGALVRDAKASGWQVQATRREVHVDDDIKAFCVTDSVLHHSITLDEAYWVCAIPPRMRQSETLYLETLRLALETAASLKCRGFLLCSSTAVYGSDSGHFDEQSPLAPKDTTRQQILQTAEQMVREQNGKVARLAGLVGPSREPGRFISGKHLSSSSQALVNMVDQQDVVNGLLGILSNWQSAKPVYNICHPAHPTKQDYYQKHCTQYGSEPPSFASDESVARVIDGTLITELGFEYRHDI